MTNTIHCLHNNQFTNTGFIETIQGLGVVPHSTAPLVLHLDWSLSHPDTHPSTPCRTAAMKQLVLETHARIMPQPREVELPLEHSRQGMRRALVGGICKVQKPTEGLSLSSPDPRLSLEHPRVAAALVDDARRKPVSALMNCQQGDDGQGRNVQEGHTAVDGAAALAPVAKRQKRAKRDDMAFFLKTNHITTQSKGSDPAAANAEQQGSGCCGFPCVGNPPKPSQDSIDTEDDLAMLEALKTQHKVINLQLGSTHADIFLAFKADDAAAMSATAVKLSQAVLEAVFPSVDALNKTALTITSKYILTKTHFKKRA